MIGGPAESTELLSFLLRVAGRKGESEDAHSQVFEDVFLIFQRLFEHGHFPALLHRLYSENADPLVLSVEVKIVLKFLDAELHRTFRDAEGQGVNIPNWLDACLLQSLIILFRQLVRPLFFSLRLGGI